MALTFLRKLDELRREFGIDDSLLKEYVKILTRKQRGQKPKNETGKITRYRKKTIANRRDEYEQKLEEYVDALHSTSFSLKEYEAHHNEISKVELGYMIHTDIAREVTMRNLKSGSLPPDDTEKLKEALYYATLAPGIDSPRRRDLMGVHIKALDDALQRLRRKIT
jgi:hypothetical protein